MKESMQDHPGRDGRASRIEKKQDHSSGRTLADAAATFDQSRPRLFSIAYRMLGSASDAEDILQEAFLRFQKSSLEEIQSSEAFLVTIVSRLCINHMKSARVTREQYVGQWLPEPVLTEPAVTPLMISEMDESLSIAFLTLLERLTPMERAVFLLREVFDYRYAEIGAIVEQTESNCRQILRRARHHLRENRPRFSTSQQEREEMMQRFMEASKSGDMDGLLTLFAKDIVLYGDGGGKAAAVPNPIIGAANVARFLVGWRQKRVPAQLVSCMVEINGQPGIVSYVQGKLYSVLTLEVADGYIRNIFVVTNPDKLSQLSKLPPPC